MDKYDYINLITEYLRGRTGMNFQKLVGIVFKEYYTYKRYTYEMPASFGGDKKNDGWVIEKGLFYQIYAPSKKIDSQKKDIQNKFSNDLDELLYNVYIKGLWNGKLNEFIYLVNTFDNDLPEDSDRYYEKEAARLQNIYNVDFKYKVVNISYIYDVLCDVKDIDVLEKISALLKIRGTLDYNGVSEEIMIKLIMKISANISEKYLNLLQNGNSINKYKRVSSVKKISINDLEKRRDIIETIISNLDVVENAIKSINQDILFENRFERVKSYVVGKYEILSNKLHGIELYDKLIIDLIEHAGHEEMDKIGAEFLVVFIFDKCDIFEKE